MRWLVLTHRYLGIALGILMLAWCLSGIVMMYVAYPRLTREERLHALRPLDLRGCCASLDAQLQDTDPVASFQLEMLAGRPILRMRQGGAASLIDLRDGRVMGPIAPELAQQVASDYAA